MGHERAVMMNRSAERLAEATLASWDAVTDAAARQQEQLARFALGWTEESIEMLKGQAEANLGLAETLTEQYEKQAEALEILTRESTEAWVNLLFASVSGSGKANGASEDFDRLSVEEISRRLEKLSSREITKLKAYEERHKKHSSLLERFDRALV
jgi:hypothetical protein